MTYKTFLTKTFLNVFLDQKHSSWRTRPFGEFESELTNERQIDTTFIIPHDFRKCRVPANTNLDRNYIFPNDLASNGIQCCPKSVGKALSVAVSIVECTFGSVKLLSTAASGVLSQDLLGMPPRIEYHLVSKPHTSSGKSF